LTICLAKPTGAVLSRFMLSNGMPRLVPGPAPRPAPGNYNPMR